MIASQFLSRQRISLQIIQHRKKSNRYWTFKFALIDLHVYPVKRRKSSPLREKFVLRNERFLSKMNKCDLFTFVWWNWNWLEFSVSFLLQFKTKKARLRQNKKDRNARLFRSHYWSTTRVKILKNWTCLHFPFRLSASSPNTLRNLQPSYKISAAVSDKISIRFGQDISRNASKLYRREESPALTWDIESTCWSWAARKNASSVYCPLIYAITEV